MGDCELPSVKSENEQEGSRIRDIKGFRSTKKNRGGGSHGVASRSPVKGSGLPRITRGEKCPGSGRKKNWRSGGGKGSNPKVVKMPSHEKERDAGIPFTVENKGGAGWSLGTNFKRRSSSCGKSRTGRAQGWVRPAGQEKKTESWSKC